MTLTCLLMRSPGIVHKVHLFGCSSRGDSVASETSVRVGSSTRLRLLDSGVMATLGLTGRSRAVLFSGFANGRVRGFNGCRRPQTFDPSSGVLTIPATGKVRL